MQKNKNEDDDLPSMQGLLNHMRQDIADSAKAHELREKELKSIIKDCESGKLSVEAALDRHYDYQERWGEPLPGIRAYPNVSDETIVKSIDEVRNGTRWLNRVSSEPGLDKSR